MTKTTVTGTEADNGVCPEKWALQLRLCKEMAEARIDAATRTLYELQDLEQDRRRGAERSAPAAEK